MSNSKRSRLRLAVLGILCIGFLISVALILGQTAPWAPKLAENISETEQGQREVVAPSPEPAQKIIRQPQTQSPPSEATASAPTTETKMRSIDELLLFFPSKFPNGDWNPSDLEFQDVYFVSEDETKLHGWYCPAKEPRAVVLIAHGNAGNVAWRAPWLRYLQTQANASVFMFDYRGYGRSEGTPTVEGAIQDARAARKKLCELASIQDSDMLLMGESLGGAIVIQLAAESPPRALILQSTFSSLRDVADVHFPKLSWLVPKSKLDSATQIAGYKGPLLQSHGSMDETIPFVSGEKLFGSANEPKQFVTIENADHNNWLTEAYLQQLDEFLARVAR